MLVIKYGICNNPQKCVQVYTGYHCMIMRSYCIIPYAKYIYHSWGLIRSPWISSYHQQIAIDHIQIMCYIFADYTLKIYSFLNDITVAIVIWSRTARVNFWVQRAYRTGSNLWADAHKLHIAEGQYDPFCCSPHSKIHPCSPGPYYYCNSNIIEEWIYFQCKSARNMAHNFDMIYCDLLMIWWNPGWVH